MTFFDRIVEFFGGMKKKTPILQMTREQRFWAILALSGRDGVRWDNKFSREEKNG